MNSMPDEIQEMTASNTMSASLSKSQGGAQVFFGAIPEFPTQEAIDGLKFDFNDGLRVRLPDGAKPYRIRFVDLDNKFSVYDVVTPEGGGGTVTSFKKYFIRFRLVVSDPKDDRLLFHHDYNAEGKAVIIRFPVHTLGDTIAWFSYVERFQQKHKCELYCVVSPWFVEIVREQYPKIKFITKEEAEKINSYANYNIGLWELGNTTHQPLDHRYIGLHKIAAQILGVGTEEIPPRFNLSAPRRIREKYVCIAVQSTSLAKMWNNPIGWRAVVDFLKQKGYRVLCIDQAPFTGKAGTYTYMPPNAEDFTGNKPLQERIDLIKDADFFIGLSSGLSWLAWGCKVPVVLISGFTAPWNEFHTPYRIINYNVCNSCWNDFKDFDLSNYWHCPRQENTERKFECSAMISPDHVIDVITSLIQDRFSDTI